jgi:hypothetical protein
MGKGKRREIIVSSIYYCGYRIVTQKKFNIMDGNLANTFEKWYPKEELFLFGVKDSMIRISRLNDHCEQG